MLRLADVKKDYTVGDLTTHALRGVSLSFRKNEFVSVLGPSGCGKTTLLNIIGGLDRYSSGDVYINGRSTREFKDADWDVYRNHRVGFIFQSYNLIPHQTILGNVELALTIAGMSKAERVKRAKEALDKVGLEGLYNKKPNQLSGGQCQRVAIARALVNEPEILLADEPTGALDTGTSVQIMELIKEISREKLVIMVTHNPELAEKYSTRIIKLLDGEVVSDSAPYSEEEEQRDNAAEAERAERALKAAEEADKAGGIKKKKRKKERAKMSFFTAFKLSAQNLFTKKARTIMASIAGSIGIIGISLVLSISYGVQSYIKGMQNDMLSGNPITITEKATDLAGLMQGTSSKDKIDAIKENGYVNVDSLIDFLVSRSAQADSLVINNTITQQYIDYVSAIPKEQATVFLDYGLDVTNNIYTDFKENRDAAGENMSLSAIRTIYTAVLKQTQFKDYATYVTSLSNVFMQAPSDSEYIGSQYDLAYGKIAEKENEIMIVLDGDSELTDLLLAQLGYYSQDEFLNMIYKSTEDPDYNPDLDKTRFSYEELLGKSFVWYPNDEIFERNGSDERSPFTYKAYNEGFESGKELQIVGILEPKEDISYGCLRSGFFYTEALTRVMIDSGLESEIAEYFNSKDIKSFTSTSYNGMDFGITFKYSFTYLGEKHENVTGFVGTPEVMSSLMNGMGYDMAETFTLTLQNLGGVNMANGISVYPIDFITKDYVLAYLDKWNSEEDVTVNGVVIPASERDDIIYTDNLSLIIDLINNFIDIVTYALIGFTGLSLVVSCVMIAIITFVSVVERTKEIGVIRSLGGRKRDVSFLFNAETFIIGLGSGLIGILFTYILSAVANIIIKSLTGIATIAIFPWHYAVIMVCVSVVLTLISGLFPSRSAAKKDPVVALRTE